MISTALGYVFGRGAVGTMNRQATVLCTPVHSQFQGFLVSVDGYLIKQDTMMHVIDSTENPRIQVSKKRPTDGELWKQGPVLVCEFIHNILS